MPFFPWPWEGCIVGSMNFFNFFWIFRGFWLFKDLTWRAAIGLKIWWQRVLNLIREILVKTKVKVFLFKGFFWCQFPLWGPPSSITKLFITNVLPPMCNVSTALLFSLFLLYLNCSPIQIWIEKELEGSHTSGGKNFWGGEIDCEDLFSGSKISRKSLDWRKWGAKNRFVFRRSYKNFVIAS